MKLSSRFACELGTYHQETKVTYCRWLGQEQSHISFGAALTSRRSRQHGGPTRLIRGRQSLKTKTLDLIGRNDGHHRAQHGLSSSGLAPHLEWSFVNSAVLLPHTRRRSDDGRGVLRAMFLRQVFPSKKGEKPGFGFTAFHHSIQLHGED